MQRLLTDAFEHWHNAFLRHHEGHPVGNEPSPVSDVAKLDRQLAPQLVVWACDFLHRGGIGEFVRFMDYGPYIPDLLSRTRRCT